jgi:hypothetical protein
MRYVLLKHTKEKKNHVDFLLDCGEKRLLTWQIKNPIFFQWLINNTEFLDFNEILTDTIETSCQRIFDHRQEYLDFEGKINNNRGFIEKIEWGEWDILSVESKRFVMKTTGTQKNKNIQTIKKWQCFFPTNFQQELEKNQLSDLLHEPNRFLSSFLPPVDDNIWRLIGKRTTE